MYSRLISEHVVLRAPHAGDMRELGRMRSDVALQNLLLAYPDPNTDVDTDQWLERRLNEPRGAFFVVADTQTDECMGYVQLANVHGKGRHGALGIALSDSAQGRGIGREAIARFLEYARDVMKLRKVELEVLATNERAVRLYRSLGFVEVGLRRQHYFDGSDWLDVLLMEIMLEVPNA